MSILKAKIALVQKRNQENSNSQASLNMRFLEDVPEKIENKTVSFLNRESIKEEALSTDSPSSSPKSSFRPAKKSVDSHDQKCSNNIMKNYCRGIANFAVSQMAVSYLKPLLQKHHIELDAFRKFIRAKKSKINCIKQLREMLLISETEKREVAAMKTVFKEITIIFLKYFIPNWVYNSKITDKFAHLKYRFKILRRVRNPIYFTYLQEFNS